MSFTKIYFIISVAMFLATLRDYNTFPAMAKRLTKPQDESTADISSVVQRIMNLTVMALFAFFLWPAVVFWEYDRI